MKKTLLLLFALISSIGMAWAQVPTNYAASASIHPASGAPESFYSQDQTRTTQTELAGLINGATNDVRYIGGKKSSTDATPVINSFYLDLGDGTLNYKIIKMYWEGAYASPYTIYGSYSTDNLKADVLFEQTSAPSTGNTNPQIYTLENAADYRYLYFDFSNATARDINWGVKMYEIQVYENYTPVVTTLTASCANTSLTIGDIPSITVTAKDQIDLPVSPGAYTFMTTNASVVSVENNIVKAEGAGTASITARNGDVVSNPIDFTVLGASKLTLTASNVFVTGNTTKMNTFNKCVDGTTTGGGEAAWVLSESNTTVGGVNSSFILDLKALYTISQIDFYYEGACAKDYTVEFSQDGTTWNSAYTKENMSDGARHDVLSGYASSDNVRFIRYQCTSASQWGVKILELEIFGTQTSTITDETAPVATTVEYLPDGEKTYSSAQIKLNATESTSGIVAVELNVNGTDRTPFAIPSNADYVYTIEGLSSGDNTVKVKFNDGFNESAERTETVTTLVLPTPKEPTFNSDDVLGLNSAKYGTLSGLTYYDWGGNSTSVTTITAGGREVRQVSNFGTLGQASFAVQDISGKKECHISIFPVCEGTVDIDIHPIYNDGSERDKENFVTVTGNKWNYIYFNIDEVANADYTKMGQFKLSKRHAGTDKITIYFADLYFVNPTVDITAPTMTKVEVTPGANTATLTVQAEDDHNSLTYKVYSGSTEIASTTGTQGNDATVTITGLISETTYAAGTFKVTATDAAGNESTAMDVPAFTTTAKPMSGDFSTTTFNSSNPDVNGKVINYTCTFTQSGTDVTVTFTYTTPENIPGLVFNGVTATGGNVPEKGSYKWTGCSTGDVLKAHSSWAAESGGMAETQEFYYVVAGENAGLVKMPADANDINEILGTGTVSATAFKELTTIEEKAYDLTNLKVTSAVALEAKNKNAVFIVKEDQKTNLAGTNNLLVWDEENSRYASDEITITDQPSAYNLFASNLTIYTKDAQYVREGVGANQYFTVALPFAGNTPENFSAYTAGVASANVTFTKVASGEMAAANPYVVHNVNESAADFTVTTTGVNAVLDFTETKPDNSCMESVFTMQTTSDTTTDIYALMADPNDAGKVVFHAAKGVTLIPFRAIFSGSSLATARAIFLDGETTKIGAIDVDGKIETGAIYNLAGQRVQNPTKGIYIINGKKVVLK